MTGPESTTAYWAAISDPPRKDDDRWADDAREALAEARDRQRRDDDERAWERDNAKV